MSSIDFPLRLTGVRFYFVGLKGTGTSALAELLQGSGAHVSGSDIADTFYTDQILNELGLVCHQGFDAANVPSEPCIVVHSAAYSSATNCELAEASRRGLPILKYTEALGAYSAHFDSSGIAGVHGKTTTTALAGTLCQALKLPAKILAGSAVGDFGGRSTLNLGNSYFIAETCEYRRHFLAFHPHRIVLTSVESDHQDYYPDYESIRSAFVEYGLSLPEGGELIYCADDEGAVETAALIAEKRGDLRLIPYGLKAGGKFHIQAIETEEERSIVHLPSFPSELRLRVPGSHVALDAVAALALVSSLLRAEYGSPSDDGWNAERFEAVRSSLEAFRGSRRRAEIIGEAEGVLVMDDYAHHPTAIKTTLEGIKAFYPKRRLVLSFMSHTYTRTAALLDDFASSFADADILILHKIYGSAREEYSGGVTGKTLFEKTAKLQENVIYIDEHEDALDQCLALLQRGDLFLTMGAGDNWKLGRSVYQALQTKTGSSK